MSPVRWVTVTAVALALASGAALADAPATVSAGRYQVVEVGATVAAKKANGNAWDAAGVFFIHVVVVIAVGILIVALLLGLLGEIF